MFALPPKAGGAGGGGGGGIGGGSGGVKGGGQGRYGVLERVWSNMGAGRSVMLQWCNDRVRMGKWACDRIVRLKEKAYETLQFERVCAAGLVIVVFFRFLPTYHLLGTGKK